VNLNDGCFVGGSIVSQNVFFALDGIISPSFSVPVSNICKTPVGSPQLNNIIHDYCNGSVAPNPGETLQGRFQVNQLAANSTRICQMPGYDAYCADPSCGQNYFHFYLPGMRYGGYSYAGTPTQTYTCPNGGDVNGTTCEYDATNTPVISYPFGGVYNAGNNTCVLPGTGFEIDGSTIGSGTCIPATIATDGSTTECTYTLTGAPVGVPYIIPSGGITASITTATGNSDPCTLSTGGDELVCSNIPGTNGTNGNQTALTTLGGSAPVTLQDNPTTIGESNNGTSTDCTSTTNVTIGQTYTCTFPLNGDPNDNYALPGGGITASTDTATGNSDPCTIINNGSATAALECTNISTDNGTQGVQDVLVLEPVANISIMEPKEFKTF
jgi:hypothetical protein